ncbi:MULTISPECIES: hypothetical protein [Crateriforma]|uniref:Uncharacterized protein n=1 Tax=Crateriforma conspicua TaxID=2527996 RepID=A0A5C6G2I2_9PLAN|nr:MULTISPECIES: hypothetical protein [Crateriforma]TWU67600.1 hypothetical protein V7x_31750 [Crateriforma conspicua]
MIYFIFWTILIVAIAASVPVVNAIENKKRREALGPVAEEEPVAEEDAFEAEAEEMDEPAEFGEPVGEEPVADDFSAFDEEFK